MELDYAFMADTFIKVWSGAGATLKLTALSLLLAAPLAFYMAMLRIKGHVFGSCVTKVYISFVRGTPIILQILLLYSLLPSFLNVLFRAVGSDFNVFDRVDPFWYAVAVFTLNTVALLAEVFRSALLSISPGQLEAGVSIGLSELQTYRHIIIP
jgi:L-cystine transport system permease protein